VLDALHPVIWTQFGKTWWKRKYRVEPENQLTKLTSISVCSEWFMYNFSIVLLLWEYLTFFNLNSSEWNNYSWRLIDLINLELDVLFKVIVYKRQLKINRSQKNVTQKKFLRVGKIEKLLTKHIRKIESYKFLVSSKVNKSIYFNMTKQEYHWFAESWNPEFLIFKYQPRIRNKSFRTLNMDLNFDWNKE